MCISGLLLRAVKSVVIDLSYYYCCCCCFYQQLTVFGSHTTRTETAQNLNYALTISTRESQSQIWNTTLNSITYKGDDNDDNVQDDDGGHECSDIHRTSLHAGHTHPHPENGEEQGGFESSVM